MTRKFNRITVALAILTLTGCGTAATTPAPETPQQRDQRMGWWRDARFGLFIHWGLYCVPAGQWKGHACQRSSEFIAEGEKIQVSEYESLAGQFNPTQFNAAEWVSLAKEAGMKYIVITTKHHEGFCLFNSAYTNYDMVDATPFKRDIMKELADECHKQGIEICWYYSILDWHHPDYLPRPAWDTRPTAGADFNRYAAYMKNQLTELLTHYGRIGVLWFDGSWGENWTHPQAVELASYIRSLQPSLIINNRIDKAEQVPGLSDKDGSAVGDFGTPEARIPAKGMPGVDWESCLSINSNWGYNSGDTNFTDSAGVILRLVKAASRGGNLLFNVGPTAQGEFPAPCVKSLKETGAWLKVNGESIYGTKAGIFGALPWGFCTVRPGKIYLHIFHWPYTDRLEVPEIENNVTGAYMLADPAKTPLKFANEDCRLVINLSPDTEDSQDWVVVLTVDGDPELKAK